MHKYLLKNGEVTFEKIFSQRLGYLLFKDFCENVYSDPVPQIKFYEAVCFVYFSFSFYLLLIFANFR